MEKEGIPKIKHIDIVVRGRVQGVFFRENTKEKAKELGIMGFVKNLDDGNVLIEAEGEEGKLEKLIDWCRIGPPMASVDSIDVKEKEEIKNLKTFSSV